jgi:hypothetical protein
MGRVQAAFADPAGVVVRERTRRTPLTSRPAAIVAAGLGLRLGQLAWLVAASCAAASVLLMPAQATGLSDLKAGQAMTAPAKCSEEASPEAFPMEDFLDRLMVAESGGRLRKKNPRSTALGPFQFIESTFLFVVSKHFQSEVAGLSEQQILARRTDMSFSRRVARAYVLDLISALASKGLPASSVNVRIAFLVGPSAALRLLGTPPDQPVKMVLSADAVAANPFMARVTIAQLMQRAAVEVGTSEPERIAPAQGEPDAEAATLKQEPVVELVAFKTEPPDAALVSKSDPVGTPLAPQTPPLATTSAGAPFGARCQIGLASCRRWMALQDRKASQSSGPGAQP